MGHYSLVGGNLGQRLPQLLFHPFHQARHLHDPEAYQVYLDVGYHATGLSLLRMGTGKIGSMCPFNLFLFLSNLQLAVHTPQSTR